MTPRLFTKAALLTTATLCMPTYLSAQTAEEVRLDVLSALSTPLPITVIGPLLTRYVTVVEEDDGFRATMEDTTLMGFFPFGEVSMKLVALDEDTYQVSDLQIPQNLDFPGLITVSFDDISLDGTWSAADRSYEALEAELTGLRVVPGQGDQGELTLGRLAFDVQKEPDETETESRFDITLADVSAIGFGSENVTVGEVKALLSANGERPVDLYSVLREVMMVASLRDGGAGLQTVAESLLGNTYGTVALDLTAGDLNVVDTQAPEESYFRATGLQARLGMEDVRPRDWGSAELSVHLDGVEHQNLIDSGAFEVERAVVRLGGKELPVADMFGAVRTLGRVGHANPIRVSDLLDGFLEFAALELTTEGEALKVEVHEGKLVDGDWVEDIAFVTGYDSWQGQIALTGLNTDEGVLTSVLELAGGTFTPGPNFAEEDQQHLEAWYPLALRYGGQVSNLNTGFLKQLFQDVTIQDMNEPIEIFLPLALYASASVFEVSVEDNRYETGLFSAEQSGEYRAFPAKFMSLAPIEGQLNLRMTGFDALMGYFDGVLQEEAAKDGRLRNRTWTAPP